jgi:hypothetical protein
MLSDATNATRRAVGLWQQAVTENGAGGVVIIARDNHTREELNAAARELWGALGLLGEGRTYGGLTVAVGDRVICRQNNARLDVDNGMRGSVRELDSHRVMIETDAGAIRELPAAYVEEHLEHAYALTGHSMQGGTVERAIVLASPRDLTGGWSYTALSRARAGTSLLIVDQDRDGRSEFAPADGALPREGLLDRVARRMLQRDDEDLAVEQFRHEHPERAAERAEPPVRRRDRERITELEARAATLTSDQARVERHLDDLPPLSPRIPRKRDPHELERAHLGSVLKTLERELLTVLDEQGRLMGGLEDASRATCEHGLEREHAETAWEHAHIGAMRQEGGHARPREPDRDRDLDGGIDR